MSLNVFKAGYTKTYCWRCWMPRYGKYEGFRHKVGQDFVLVKVRCLICKEVSETEVDAEEWYEGNTEDRMKLLFERKNA